MNITPVNNAAAIAALTNAAAAPAQAAQTAAPAQASKRDELILSSDALKAVEEEKETKSSGKLTDKEIYELFIGKPTPKANVMEIQPGVFAHESGTEEMFDQDGNFLYKDNEHYINSLKSFFQFNIYSGVPLNEQRGEHIAKFFGEVGKRVDAAYAEGKFDAEQKAALDKMIEDSAMYYAEKNERLQALLAIGREEGSNILKRMETMELMKDKTFEERMEIRKKQVDEYVEKYYKIDRKELMDMINSIRENGKNEQAVNEAKIVTEYGKKDEENVKEEPDNKTESEGKTTVSVNVQKRMRQIAAASTKGDMQAVMSLLDTDLSDCKKGLANGRCDESEVAKAEALIRQAKSRMAQLSDDDEDSGKNAASTLALNMLM